MSDQDLRPGGALESTADRASLLTTGPVPRGGRGPTGTSTLPSPGAPGGGRPAYRHDLDGLRAVAIGLVAVYHVFVERVSGGVDVFLMLSGFFVVGGLLRGFRAGSPVRLVPYLAKLVRRLVPSLVLVLGGVLGAAYLWLPRSQWESLAHQTLASVQYRLNWLLAATGQEYGAANAAQSPLQHIWSMSVQGQLFVAVPVVLLLVWAVTRPLPTSVRYGTLVVVVVLACAASFVYAMHAVKIDQPHAYYDTFARAWEYLAGALLALCAPHLRLPRALAHLASVIGVCLILAAGVLVDGAGTFPGPETLVPLTGAALIILAGAWGDRRGVVNAALAWRPLSRAGRYAYTFYLWHWPVLVFTVVVTDAPVTVASGVFVLAASAVLAVVTHVLVEEPVRATRPQRVRGQGAGSGRRALAVSLTVVSLAAAVGAPMKWLAHVRDLEEQAARQVNVAQPSLGDFTGDVAGLPEAIRSNPGALAVAFPDLLSYDRAAALIPDPTIAAKDLVRPDLEACFLPPGQADATWCEFGDPDATRVLAAVGGSHVRTWVDVLDALGKEHGFRVRVAVKWSCTFFADPEGIELNTLADDCVDWNDAVMTDLLVNPPDTVFSIATRRPWGGTEIAPAGYVAAWERLNAAGIPVIGLRDNPYLPFMPNDCVIEGRLDDPACTQPRAGVYAEASPFDGLDRREIPLTQFIDLSGIYCPDGVCPLVQGGRVVYLDDSHLTASYAQTLGPILDQEMGPLLGWW